MHFPGEQFIMRIRAPKCAAAAQPGSFVHITCDESLPMRRPLSIMRVGDDWIEFFTRLSARACGCLSGRSPATRSACSARSANRSTCRRAPQRLVDWRRRRHTADGLPRRLAAPGRGHWTPLAILGSEIPFPFDLQNRRSRSDGVGSEYSARCLCWRVGASRPTDEPGRI